MLDHRVSTLSDLNTDFINNQFWPTNTLKLSQRHSFTYKCCLLQWHFIFTDMLVDIKIKNSYQILMNIIAFKLKFRSNSVLNISVHVHVNIYGQTWPCRTQMSMNNLFAVLYLQKPWLLATEARENKQSKQARWSTAFLYLLNPSLNCLKNTPRLLWKLSLHISLLLSLSLKTFHIKWNLM